ncbi:hypothetical protein JK333_18410 [Klebsiella michiganensis]|nr:hypothetical protein [Klebsiella michiganensis]MBL0791033.1 hypothetical protein [Klebsiella michiganensis]MDU6587004.1 hypothetical protein [Klebsiella michiganensis]
MAVLGLRVVSPQQLRESLWTGEIPFTTTEQGIVVAPNTALNLALRFHQR